MAVILGHGEYNLKYQVLKTNARGGEIGADPMLNRAYTYRLPKN